MPTVTYCHQKPSEQDLPIRLKLAQGCHYTVCNASNHTALCLHVRAAPSSCCDTEQIYVPDAEPCGMSQQHKPAGIYLEKLIWPVAICNPEH